MPDGWVDFLGLYDIDDQVDYSDDSHDTDDDFAYASPVHEPEASAAQEPPASLNTEELCQGPAKRQNLPHDRQPAACDAPPAYADALQHSFSHIMNLQSQEDDCALAEHAAFNNRYFAQLQGASNSPPVSFAPTEARDSDDNGLAPDVLAAAARRARDFAALQARQQGMFPGLAFFLVRLTSHWCKPTHEYVDSRSWGNHGVHVHDGRGCAQAPPCYFAEDNSGIVGQVDSRNVAAVAAARALCTRPAHRHRFDPVRAALYHLAGLSFDDGGYTGRGDPCSVAPTAPFAHAYINTLASALLQALLHAAATYTEHNRGSFPMRHPETVEGIVSRAQSRPQVASARGLYLQDVPQIYPHLATDPEIADFIVHSCAWTGVLGTLRTILGHPPIGHSVGAPKLCSMCLIQHANDDGRLNNYSPCEWAHVGLRQHPNASRPPELGSFMEGGGGFDFSVGPQDCPWCPRLCALCARPNLGADSDLSEHEDQEPDDDRDPPHQQQGTGGDRGGRQQAAQDVHEHEVHRDQHMSPRQKTRRTTGRRRG